MTYSEQQAALAIAKKRLKAKGYVQSAISLLDTLYPDEEAQAMRQVFVKALITCDRIRRHAQEVGE